MLIVTINICEGIICLHKSMKVSPLLQHWSVFVKTPSQMFWGLSLTATTITTLWSKQQIRFCSGTDICWVADKCLFEAWWNCEGLMDDNCVLANPVHLLFNEPWNCTNHDTCTCGDFNKCFLQCMHHCSHSLLHQAARNLCCLNKAPTLPLSFSCVNFHFHFVNIDQVGIWQSRRNLLFNVFWGYPCPRPHPPGWKRAWSHLQTWTFMCWVSVLVM